MTKLTKQNLPRGTALGPTQIYNNLNGVVTAINGVAGAVNLDNDNREQTRGRFVLTWNMTAMQGQVRNFFNIPLLQEWFLASKEPTTDTPVIRLDSLCLSWDRGGQQEARVLRATAAAPALLINYKYKLGETPDNDAYARIYQGTSTDSRVVGEVQISKEEFGRKADETDFIDIMPKYAPLNITVDPYKPYIMEFQAPFESNPVHNVLIKAEFSHTLVERDHAALRKFDTTPLAPRNLPLHNNSRTASAYSLTTPVEGDSIDATGVKGVQTQIETIDDVLVKGLSCGLDRYSRVLRGENLLEDQGYFAMTVPLFNFEGVVGQTELENYNNNVFGGVLGKQIWDRAIIPIVFPMTIHHVQVSFYTDALTLADWPLSDRELQVGVAASYQIKPWWTNRLYTQIARTPTNFVLSNTSHRIGSQGLWAVPLSYPGTPDGIGWAEQGRPVFVGQEHGNQNQTGVAQRSQVADNANGGALINSPTNGAEQVIEVRALLKSLAGTTISDSSLGAHTAFPRGGIFVHIYGKAALTE